MRINTNLNAMIATNQMSKNTALAGSSMEKVVKTTCFLANMEDFTAFNAIYAQYFPGRPARSCVAVKTLPNQVLVEVEAIAEQE